MRKNDQKNVGRSLLAALVVLMVHAGVQVGVQAQPCGTLLDRANADLTGYPNPGTISSGTYANTNGSDNSYEVLREAWNGTYNQLIHKWTIPLSGTAVTATSRTFAVEAFHNATGTPIDDYIFAYSTDNITYTNMLTVTKTADNNTAQTFVLPGGLSGTLYIRVVDSSTGDTTNNSPNRNTISVDDMYVSSVVTCPTRTPTPTATRTSTPTQTSTISPSPTRSATPTPTRTVTLSPTRSATGSPTRTATNSPTPSASGSPTRTATNSPTRTASLTPTATRTATRSPTRTATLSTTRTATGSPTRTATLSPTRTASLTSTATRTATLSPTRTATGSATRTATLSATRSATLSPTRTASLTSTATRTATLSPTRTATDSATRTATLSPTMSATLSPTRTATGSPTRSATVSATRSATTSPTRTATSSATRTATATPTPTPCLGDGAGDTIGYQLGGGGGGWGVAPYPNAPMPDAEVDILQFCVTDDCSGLNFLIDLGAYPSTITKPPIVEIAVDVPGVVGVGTTWYDPGTKMTNAPNVGINGSPAWSWDVLISTDVNGGMAYLWLPGFLVNTSVPLVWTPSNTGPSQIQFTIPWGGSLPQPSQGTILGFAVMSAHSTGSGLGTSAAPDSDPDDVITNATGILANSTANELFDSPLGPYSTDYKTTHTLTGCAPTPTRTPTATTTQTATASPTVTATSSPTRTATLSPTITATLSPTRTATVSPTVTATLSPTRTATLSPTVTATLSPTRTATLSPTVTATLSPTRTATLSPTRTASASPTMSSTVTPTTTASFTVTRTATLSPTRSATLSPTRTATLSPTMSATLSPTRTATLSPTRTGTLSPTRTATLSPTRTATLSPTRTGTPSPTMSATPSPTRSATLSPTRTATLSPTRTATPSPTRTATPTPTIFIRVNPAAQSVDEAVGVTSITVELSAPFGLPVTVDYATADGTAIAPGDYTSVSGSLLFTPGETSKVIGVPIIDDLIDEPNEDFTFTLSNPVNATPDNMTQTVTILDNDPPPTVDFIPAAQSALENVGSIVVTVRLSNPSAFPISVNFATVPGTAISPDDFITTSGLLSFAPGELQKQFNVTITDDYFWEPTEDFTIQLSNPVNCSLGVGTQTDTILDDDPLPGPYGQREPVEKYDGEGRDPGLFGHLVHDSLGNLHACYYEEEQKNLKYAHGVRSPVTGLVKWSVQTVDSVGDVGRYCSIAVDPANRPAISYYDATNRKLKVAWDKNGDGDFEQNGTIFGRDDATGFYEIQSVDASSPNVGTWTSITTDVRNFLHVSYKDEYNGRLKYAYYDGFVWVVDTAATTPVAPISGDYSSILVDDTQAGVGVIRIFIAYQDGANHDLEMAWKVAAFPTWNNFATLDPGGDTGFYIDSKFNQPKDRIYVSYQDAVTTSSTEAKLKLATIDLSGFFVSTEEVQSCTPNWLDPCPVSSSTGDWGYYSSVAVDGSGLPYIAHYDNTYGNLLLEHRLITSQFPLIPPSQYYAQKRRVETTGDVGLFTSSDHHAYTTPVSQDIVRTGFWDASHTAFRMATIVNDAVNTNTATYVDGAKVGEYSSVGVDLARNAVLAYYDNPKGSLYLTRKIGPNYKPWSDPFLVDDSSASRARPLDIYTIDSNKYSRADFSQTGLFVSMVVDPTDHAHLAYYDQLRRELNYSVADLGTSTTMRIGVDERPERGQYAAQARFGAQYAVAYYQALDPNFSSEASPDPLGNGPQLRVAIGDGFTSGGWTLMSVDNSGDVGRYCSLAYDSSGNLHAAYYDGTNYNLKYARLDVGFGVWFTQTVDASPNLDGLYTSIAINPVTNQPAISYYDLTAAALKYAEFNGVGWNIQTVDDVGDVGLYTQLRFDPVRGVVYILYHDATNEALKIAIRTIANPTWTIIDTVESGGVGMRPSLFIDSNGRVRMSYYDEQRGDLIYRETAPPPASAVAPIIWTQYE